MKYTNYYTTSTFKWMCKEFNNIWLFADPHFNDPESKLMNPNWPDADEIVKKINSKVGKKDAIVFLGDIGDVEYIKKIKGYKVLIMGNHDKGASNYLKDLFWKGISYEDVKTYTISELKESYMCDRIESCGSDYIAIWDNQLFDEVYEGPLFINEKILLSHEPIKIPGVINLHGHAHNSQHIDYMQNEYACINFAADVIDFTPIRIDDAIRNIKVKSIHRITIDRATSKK